MAQGVSHQAQLLRDSWLTSVSAPSPPTSTSSTLRNSAKMADKREKEIIHSGHFMVSHFEAEAQDDEDTELPMPDPDENLSAIVPLNTCTGVLALSGVDQQSHAIVSTSARTNNAVIDISLAKLFKCMNLAYRQKLTSPKWNSFKGIRLRWKDKIRLNNLIWRCWHMQFIMKKKTPVCQFASPLDVDLHSKPESVVLEGKYWKRQSDVIKAEYMKWRKFYRNRGLANAILDTVSEIDIFDWSPTTSDKNMMSIDDYCWTADTLFTTINSTPFPFPDPREIARAGIADFIQPSLGPLQPNLDDFMNELPLQELITSHLSSRLPPVPEEDGGGDDGMFRGDMSYDFPAIMDSEPMDSSMIQQTTITDVTNVELNARDQLSESIVCASAGRTMQQSQNPANMLPFNTQSQASLLSYQSNLTQTQAMPPPSMNQLTMSRSGNNVPSQIQTQSMLNQNSTYMGASTNQAVIQSQNVDLSNLTGAKKRTSVKERGVRSQLFGRREPHNYDKSTPTQHQTNLYNQMLAQQNRNQLQLQQQQQQQQQQQTQLNNSMSGSSTIYNSTNYLGSQNIQSPIQTTTNTYGNALNLTSNNTFNLQQNQMNSNIMNMMPNTTQQTQMQASQSQTATAKSSSNLLSLLSMKSPSNETDIDISQLDPYKMTTTGSSTNAYKPYSLQQSMKSASFQQLSQRNLSVASSVASQMNSLTAERQQQLSINTAAIDKELFRSKSLPMNSTLQLPVMREESFVVPKYQASKLQSNRIRARSTSMISKQQHHSTPSLQSAASEPMLKTLAQLLTTPSNSSGGSSSVTNLQQSNVLQNANVVSPNEITMSQSQQKKQINQFQSQFTAQFSQPLSPDNKFVGSPGASALSPGSSGESMQRRVGHIHAEQKRRYNIKNGFDMLHSLIPQLQQNPNAKLSKAAMLQKGAEYIKQLRSERDAVNQKMDVLRKERDALNNSLNHLHSVLPANGAPVSRQRTSRVKEMYTEYVREKTLQNWKFWILGLIFEPLLNSYNATVSVASMEELYRSAMIWVDQHCSLIEIRPAVSDKLRYLSTTTDILSEPPSTLQDEVLKAISSNNVGSSTNLL